MAVAVHGVELYTTFTFTFTFISSATVCAGIASATYHRRNRPLLAWKTENHRQLDTTHLTLVSCDVTADGRSSWRTWAAALVSHIGCDHQSAALLKQAPAVGGSGTDLISQSAVPD